MLMFTYYYFLFILFLPLKDTFHVAQMFHLPIHCQGSILQSSKVVIFSFEIMSSLSWLEVTICSCHSVPMALQFFLFFIIAAYPLRSYYGAPDYVCAHCSVVFWYQERVQSQNSASRNRIVFNLCCCRGKIALPTYRDFPPILKDLICFDGPAGSNYFMRLIRQYASFCYLYFLMIFYTEYKP